MNDFIPPAQLAIRHAPRLGDGPMLVVDPPDARTCYAIEVASGAPITAMCRSWPTWKALSDAGMDLVPFGPWLPRDAGPWHSSLVFLPKGRERIDMTAVMAASGLVHGGLLWIVGPKKGGISGARRTVEKRLGEVVRVDSGCHSKILEWELAEDPPDVHLEDFVSRWELSRGGVDLEIHSLPGVFGHGRLDDGTAMLLDVLPPAPGDTLDVGCGAGVIGAFVARRDRVAVVAVDADANAIEAARRTMRANGLDTVEVAPADVYPDLERRAGAFSLVVSNPPFHQGIETDHAVGDRLVADAPSRLAPDGSLVLVANRFLPFAGRVHSAFGGFDVLAEDGRFRVYLAPSTALDPRPSPSRS